MVKISAKNAAKSVSTFQACIRLVKDPSVNWIDKVIMCTWFIYLLSPIDPIPELLVGPIGLVDDTAIGLRAAYLIYQAYKYYRHHTTRSQFNTESGL
jgi:uncharacterized membrane protein YkvA (DUF1232 family)